MGRGDTGTDTGTGTGTGTHTGAHTGTDPATTGVSRPPEPEPGAGDVDVADVAAAAGAPRLTSGTEPLGPADDDRYLVRRGDGRIVRMPWLLYRVVTLVDGSRDLASIAESIGIEDGHVVTAEETRHAVERRLVPAGLVDMPPGAPVAAGGAARRRPRRRAGAAVALVLAALALVVVTAAVTVLVVRPGGAPATPVVTPVVTPAAAPPAGVTAPGGIDGPPTLVGRVVDVPDVATAVVDVGGRPLRVEVAGLEPGGTPACAVDDARAFGERTLQGSQVALVPDPTLPPLPGDRWRAYVVLESQLSYTDAALQAGWATAGEGRYRAGALAEQSAAERAGSGLWGTSCRPAG